MEGNLEWLKFRDDWFDVLLALSKPEMDRLLTAIREFTNDREVPEMSGRESFPWILIKAELEKDKTSRRKAADAHREAGTKGGRPKADKTNLDIEETKKTKMVFEKPNENDENQNNQIGLIKELRVKEIKSTEVKDINCADAQNSIAQKPTKSQNLTPDDHDFWKFAKDNSELAETFYKATGIYPVKSQFGRWVNDCKDLAEAGISSEQLKKTIGYMQSEGISYTAPGSCLKTAQYLKARGSVPAKSQQKPKYNAFELLAMRENGIPVPEYDIEVTA